LAFCVRDERAAGVQNYQLRADDGALSFASAGRCRTAGSAARLLELLAPQCSDARYLTFDHIAFHGGDHGFILCVLLVSGSADQSRWLVFFQAAFGK
jgi:hypothetical protein